MEIEKTRIQRYVQSLDRVIQNNHTFLKETIEDFQDRCLRSVSVRTTSRDIAREIQETHGEIQKRLKEIKAIQQLLKGKYVVYAPRDPVRDGEITKFEQTAMKCYSRFEHSFKQATVEKGRLRLGETTSRAEVKGGPFQWFHARENQVMLLRNLRILNELDYEISPSRVEEQRQVDRDKPRSLTLFVFRGNPQSIDNLQSRMRLREHDITERRSGNELRGVLTHLREIHPSEVEKIFQRYKDSPGFTELKCLLLPVQPEKSLDEHLGDLLEKALQEMADGEVKTLLVGEASLEPSQEREIDRRVMEG